MSVNWPSTIPQITDGVTRFAEADLNPIIQSLTDRTDFLYNATATSTESGGYITMDIGFTSDCQKGMLIAYDDTTGRYIPAAAQWASEPAADGSMVPAASAYVAGVLLTDVGENTNGTLLRRGVISDPDLIQRMVPNKVAGRYFLTTNGKASNSNSFTANLPVFCFTYTTSGKLLLDPGLPETRGHSHTALTLNSANWRSVTSGSGGFPAGAKFYYPDTNDAPVRALLQSNTTGLSFTYKGAEQPDSMWGVYNNTLYVNFTISTSDVCMLHGITPYMGTDPEVRAIAVEDGNALLTANKVAGTVILGMDFSVSEENDYTGIGVTSFNKSGVKTGPIVQELYAGAGIAINPRTNASGETIPGCLEISSSTSAQSLIDMMLVNADGAMLGGAPSNVCYVLPAGINSSISGTVRIPYHESSNQQGKVVLWLKGNGSAINGIRGSVTIQRPPAAGNPVSIAAETEFIFSNISSSSPQSLYYLESDALSNLPSNGLLVLKIAAANPTANISIMTIGLQLV